MQLIKYHRRHSKRCTGGPGIEILVADTSAQMCYSSSKGIGIHLGDANYLYNITPDEARELAADLVKYATQFPGEQVVAESLARAHAAVPDEADRQRFEVWAPMMGLGTSRLLDGRYMDADTEAAWQAWQEQTGAKAKLAAAAEEVIRLNRQHAQDQYGDADKAESWACVKILRAAIA